MLTALLTAILMGTAAAPAHAAPPPLRIVARWAGPDGGWDFSSFDPVHRRLYIARSDGVTAVDVDTGRVTPHLLAASRTHAAIPINDGAEILVTEGATGSALIADAQTGAVRARIKVASKPDAALVEPVTGLAMVMDNAGGGIALIDPKTGALVSVIPFGGALESPAAAGDGRVFVNVEDRNEIAVFDIKARALVTEYKLNGCEGPTGLAYLAGPRILVSACANKVAKAVSADDGRELASLPIAARPDGAMADQQLGLAYVPTGEDGAVNVVAATDAANVRLIEAAPGQVGSRSGAIDPVTGRLFLPATKFAAPASPGDRPKAIAGAFEVLVLDRH